MFVVSHDGTKIYMIHVFDCPAYIHPILVG